MSPDNPFLKALLAEPDDDTLRLAMADWLDENDQPARAEFVRVQIELAQGVTDRERLRYLEVRQRDLLIAHEAEWVQPLADVLKCKPGEWGGWVFRRGFVEYFHVSAAVISQRGHTLATLTPVRELFLRPCTSEDVVALCGCDWLRSVTALYLDSARLNQTSTRALVDCPFLGNLRCLDAVLDAVPDKTKLVFDARFASIIRMQ
ncbi:MAG: TIGR02996 domain-containing protein [Planctomycetes bacterium]|nr:TIGR02996 domain-containing protein [Planctomycetota bacterium]